MHSLSSDDFEFLTSLLPASPGSILKMGGAGQLKKLAMLSIKSCTEVRLSRWDFLRRDHIIQIEHNGDSEVNTFFIS
jgi:hypothetical protein